MAFVSDSSDTELVASRLNDNSGVYLVPAFTGIGPPHWNANARGTIFGMTRETSPDMIVRAGLESVAYQTRDLIAAYNADGIKLTSLRVDGGMSKNNWLMQFLSNMSDLPIERSSNVEATALGVAMMAGLELKYWQDETELKKCLGTTTSFTPAINDTLREKLLGGWDNAVKSVLYYAKLSSL